MTVEDDTAAAGGSTAAAAAAAAATATTPTPAVLSPLQRGTLLASLNDPAAFVSHEVFAWKANPDSMAAKHCFDPVAISSALRAVVETNPAWGLAFALSEADGDIVPVAPTANVSSYSSCDDDPFAVPVHHVEYLDDYIKDDMARVTVPSKALYIADSEDGAAEDALRTHWRSVVCAPPGLRGGGASAPLAAEAKLPVHLSPGGGSVAGVQVMLPPSWDTGVTPDRLRAVAEACRASSSSYAADTVGTTRYAGAAAGGLVKAAWALTLRKFSDSRTWSPESPDAAVVFGDVVDQRPLLDDSLLRGAPIPLIHLVPFRAPDTDHGLSVALFAERTIAANDAHFHNSRAASSTAAAIDDALALLASAASRADSSNNNIANNNSNNNSALPTSAADLFHSILVIEDFDLDGSGHVVHHESASGSSSSGILLRVTNGLGVTGRLDHHSFEMVVRIRASDPTIVVHALYNHSQMNASGAAAILKEFSFVLNLLLDTLSSPQSSEIPVSYLYTLSPNETARVRSFGRISANVSYKPTFELIHDAFAARARSQPLAAAVEALLPSKCFITYAELNARSSALASRLVYTHGVKLNDSVLILLDRSIEMVVAIFAVLKASAIYIPVDVTTTPFERVQHIVAAANPRCIIYTPDVETVVRSMNCLLTSRDLVSVVETSIDAIDGDGTLDEALNPRASPDDTAFVVFTSGTTGVPKGVKVPHRGLTRLLDEPLKMSYLGPGRRMAQFLAPGFDGAQSEIFVALSSGSTLVLRPGPDAAAAVGVDAGRLLSSTVHVLHITPTGLAQIGNPVELTAAGTPESATLDTVFVGAEPLPPALADAWVDYVTLINLYGPTETSCFVSGCEIQRVASEPDTVTVTIGRPLVGSELWVLDREMRLVPVGVVGELWVSGSCVTNGYVDAKGALPQSENFIKAEIEGVSSGAVQLYRTGDLVRWLDNGHLQILGRRDDQVKYQGYRIEMDEVASVLLSFPSVEAACALLIRPPWSTGPMLVGVVSTTFADEEAHDALVAHAQAHLPVYMVPAVLLSRTAMPETVNGKIDRRTVEAWAISEVSLRREAAAAAAATGEITFSCEEERLVAEAISEVVAGKTWAARALPGPVAVGPQSSFFSLGGDSMSVISVVGLCRTKGIRVSASDVFKGRTVAGIVKLVKAKATPSPSVALSAEHSDRPNHLEGIARDWALRIGLTTSYVLQNIYETTPLQFGMILETFKGSQSYIAHSLYQLQEPFDSTKLASAVDALVASHDMLRTIFCSTSSAGIVQLVLPHGMVDTPLDIIPRSSVIRPGEVIADNLAKDYQSNSDRPWFRVTGFERSNELLLAVHHALFDGWSWSMVIDDLFAAYRGQRLERRPPLRRFVDHIASVNSDGPEAFWKTLLNGAPPVGPLAAPGVASFEHPALSTEPLEFGAGVPMDIIKKAAAKVGASVAVVAKVAWILTLRKYVRSNDVVFGQVLSGRDIDLEEAPRIAGPLINTVPCRIQVDDDTSLADFVQQVQTLHSELLGHAHVSMMEIQRWVGSSPETPLFNTLFIFENFPADAAIPGAKLVLKQQGDIKKAVSYPFELVLWPRDEELRIQAAFSEKLMSHSHALLISKEFDYTLATVVQSLCASQSGEKLTAHWSLAPMHDALLSTYEVGATVELEHEVLCYYFDEQVQRDPSAIAIEFKNLQLTYENLDRCGSSLAAQIAELGAGVGVRVAICLQMSAEFPLAVLAVMRSGATFVPVNSTFPGERVRSIIEDAGVSIVLSEPQERERVEAFGLQGVHFVWIDVPALLLKPRPFTPQPLNRATGSDLFAIFYTSGSTGKPKGVAVQNTGATNNVMSRSNILGSAPGRREAQFMSMGFDACQTGIWSALTRGGTLVLLNPEDPFETLPTINLLFTTPTGLAHIGDSELYPNLTHIGVAGESCPKELKDLWSKKRCFSNIYGPTEVSLHSHQGFLLPGQIVTVGTHMPNMITYIMDASRRRVPLGVVGEIVVGGVTVGGHYVNLPELTKSRYIEDPHAPGSGAVVFTTGDLGAILPDGQVVVVGRMDDQVKLKGFRVELDEVAAAVTRHPGVKAAAAIVKNKQQLVAFFTPKDLDPDEVKETVAKTLPHFMVPSAFVGLDVMPLSVNLKIDRKALAEIDVQIISEPPMTKTEKDIAAVWAEVLRLPLNSIGRSTSFFAVGGDSLLVVKVASACKQRHLPITVREIFDYQTVRRLAEVVESHSKVVTIPQPTNWPPFKANKIVEAEVAKYLDATFCGNVPDVEDILMATPLQAAIVLGTLRDRSVYTHQVVLDSAGPLDFDRLRSGFKEAARRNPILRTTFVPTSTSGVMQVVLRDPKAGTVVEVATNMDAFLASDLNRGFSDNDVFWTRLTMLGDSQVVLTINHALYDGWSLPSIITEIANAYGGHHAEPLLPSMRLFIDYLAAKPELESDEFWKAYLLGVLPCPMICAKPSQTGFAGPSFCENDATATLKELQQLGASLGVSAAVLMRAACAFTIRKYIRSNDFVFGQVLSGRDIPVENGERIVGPLLTTVPVRVKIDDKSAVADVVRSMQLDYLRVSPHSHADLVRLSHLANLPSADQLFNVLFVYENLPPSSQQKSAAYIRVNEGTKRNPTKSASYPLEIIVWPSEELLKLQAFFDPSVLDRRIAVNLLEELDFTILQLMECLRENALVDKMWSLSRTQQRALDEWGVGPQQEQTFEIVHEGYIQRVQESPEVIAIQSGDSQVTFKELDLWSNQVARNILRTTAPTKTPIAVMIPRSPSIVAAVLAVLKCECALLPIDPKTPADRLQEIFEEAKPSAILTTIAFTKLLKTVPNTPPEVVAVSEHPEVDESHLTYEIPTTTLTGDSLFAIFFTSGSTGKPKGVAVHHRGVANIINTQQANTGVALGTKILALVGVAFDAFQQVLWCSLSAGSTLILPRDESLKEEAAQADTLYLTPSGLAHLGDANNFGNVKHIVVGGESCPVTLKDHWSRSARLVNAYGPTETSITSHVSVLQSTSDVQIGHPVANTTSYILDEQLRPVPIGTIGELFIGGVGVALGYLNRNAETAERFVRNPFGPREAGRMFKTGDIGYLRPDGNFAVVGRRDDQVKLKGYRVELGEVAAAMAKHDGVVSAAAIVRDGLLVGFVSPATVDVEALRETVSSSLPFYMVPAVFVALESMPVTTNSKIDKKALAAIEIRAKKETPQGSAEKGITAVWAEILRLEEGSIDRHSSFFALGGDSITAIRAVAELQARGMHVDVAQLFRAQTVSRIAALLETDSFSASRTKTWPTAQLSSQALAEIRDRWAAEFGLAESSYVAFPATATQAGMVVATIREPSSYVNQEVLVSGDAKPLSLERLRSAARALVAQHPILRTAFAATSTDGVCQVVHQPGETNPKVNEVVVTVDGGASSSSNLEAFLEADRLAGFGLGDGPWVRFALLRQQLSQGNGDCDGKGDGDGNDIEGEHAVVLTIHHALYDGWSMPVIVQDLVAAYDGRLATNPRPSIRLFVDYVSAQDPKATEAAWTKYFDGLPTLRPLLLGPDVGGPEDAALGDVVLESQAPIAELRSQSRRLGVSLASLTKAAWALTLRKFVRGPEVTFGQVVAGRDVPVAGVERIVGPLINTIPCRVAMDDSVSVADFVRAVHDDYIAMIPHSHAGLVDIQRWSGAPGGAQLFNTLFVFENLPDEELGAPTNNTLLPGLRLRSTSLIAKESGDGGFSDSEADAVAYAFELVLWPGRETLTVSARFDRAAFSHRQAAAVVREFNHTLASMVDASGRNAILSSLWPLSPDLAAEVERLEGSGPLQTASSPGLVHEAFEGVAAVQPDAVAVEHGDTAMTYAELDARASLLASQLRGLGVAAGSFVVLLIHRSIEMVVGIFAVLKTGAAYVPVDADLPLDRIESILEDAGSSVLLYSASAAAAANAVTQSLPSRSAVLSIETASQERKASAGPVDLPGFCGASPSDAAFVVFTSGTTGRPKGVMVPHRGITRLLEEPLKTSHLGVGVRMAQFLSIGFDGAQSEVFVALSTGATLVLRSSSDPVATIRSVDVLHITPSGLAGLDPADVPNLKQVFVGAEPLTQSLADRWASRVRLINLYGPTETSCFVSGTLIAEGDVVTIGSALVGSRLYVLDDALRSVPVGVVGELFVGGPCVANGYVNRPEETALRFLSDPHCTDSDGARMYRTGDMVRWLPSGKLQIIGRRDNQVKFKGYRIELEEVTRAFSRHPSVSAAVTFVHDDLLVAVVSPKRCDDEASLRAFAATILPQYMMPSVIFAVEEMPLTSNGKADAKALAAELSRNLHADLVAPNTPRERSLAEVWSVVLAVPLAAIGRSSSFFGLGGDSISALRVVAASAKIGLKLTVADIFAAHNLEATAARAASETVTVRRAWPRAQLMGAIESQWTERVGLVSRSYDAFPATPLQTGMVLATLRDPSAYVHQSVFSCKGNIDTPRLQRALNLASSHLSILRTCFATTESEGVCQVVPSARDGDNPVEEAHTETIEEFLQCDLSRGFRLEGRNWVRVSAVATTRGDFVVITIHHALYDGWCLGAIIESIRGAYDENVAPAPRASLRDFVDYVCAQDPDESKAFWQTYLAGTATSELVVRATDESSDPSGGGAAPTAKVSMAEIRAAAKEAGVSIATVAKASWALCLRKYVRESDVIFGQVVSGRDAPVENAAGIIGPLINTVPCRVQIDDASTASEFLRKLHSQHSEMIPFAHSSLIDIKKWTPAGHDAELFNTLFVFDNLPETAQVRRESDLEERRNSVPSSLSNAYHLEIALIPVGDHLEILAQHSAAIGRKAVETILSEYASTLVALARSVFRPSQTLESFWSLCEEQERDVLRLSFGPNVELPHHRVYDGFEARVQLHPDRPAVEFRGEAISYGEVDCLASKLSSKLARAGARVGTRVAVCMQRCLEFPVAVLAVLRTGATLVPVDARFPDDRIDTILSDSSAQICVAAEDDIDRLTAFVPRAVKILSASVALLKADAEGAFVPQPHHVPTANDVFAIFYTSGSTGKPKGVAMPHIGVANVLYTQASNMGYFEECRFIHFMSVGFDAFQEATWGALAYGCTMVLPEPDDMFKALPSVDNVYITPTGLAQIGQPSQFPRIKHITVGDIQKEFGLDHHCRTPHLTYSIKTVEGRCRLAFSEK
ncbi:hypothetical protein DFJ73DRAFT_965713 [Zopfochytrium polystomum]|nr:hypothetical protein DFJ73DRAFT_965713 [Zopfochytrium polystomum]